MLIIDCIFENSVTLLENLFYYYSDRIQNAYAELFQEDFLYLINNTDIMEGVKIWCSDRINISFYTDKEEYAFMKVHFDNMLKAFNGCCVGIQEES